LKQAATSPDLESVIGGHWLNRLGIVAVLLSVSYFLKYAFDNNWIGPAGRVMIGLLAGAAVIVWSETFRKRNYLAFSYSLKAVGVGALYLSLWGAFQVYHLVTADAAFFAMILVTAFTAILALREDAELIAAYAVIGGFATPVLLSTGQNHEVVLFTYVAILDIATLVLMTFRPWKRLLVGSFFGTVVLYVGWHSTYYTSTQLSTTLFFATVFFFIFVSVPLVTGAWDEGSAAAVARSSPVVVILCLLNAAAYFLEIVAMLDYLPSAEQQNLSAWAAVGIAAVYIALSRILDAQVPLKGSRLLPLLYLAVAIGFLTIAIPLKLNQHWVTIGWLVESAVLLWVGERSASDLLRAFGLVALVLGVLRLVFYDNFHPSNLIFNARFATYGVAIAVLGAVVYYSRNQPRYATGANFAVIAINLLALLGCTYEVRDFFQRRMELPGVYGLPANWQEMGLVRDFSYSALYMSYGAGLMILGFIRKSAFLRWQALILIALTAVKVFVYDVSQLDKLYRILSFMALGVLLLSVSFLYQRDWLKLRGEEKAAES